MLGPIEWLLRRSFFQRFCVVTCLSVPFVSWGLRRILIRGSVRADAEIVLAVSAICGLMVAKGLKTLELLWLAHHNSALGVPTAIEPPPALKIIQHPPGNLRLRRLWLTIIDLLVLRPFIQRFLLFTCLALPFATWSFRQSLIFAWRSPYLGVDWLVMDAAMIIFLSAFVGLVYALQGSRIKFARRWDLREKRP